MTATLIRSEKLANGLTLELLDLSRPVVADRWVVTVLARAAVPVTAETAHGAAERWTEVRDLLGPEVVYEKKMARNFIDGAAKDALVAAIADSFWDQAVPYIGRPLFAARFVRQRYRAALARQGWYPGEKTPGGASPATRGSGR